MTKIKTPTSRFLHNNRIRLVHKKVVGQGLQSKSRDWISALDMALNAQFPSGTRGHDLKLVSDNSCQPTSPAFMKYCCETGVCQIFTSFCNPKGNAETERFIPSKKNVGRFRIELPLISCKRIMNGLIFQLPAFGSGI